MSVRLVAREREFAMLESMLAEPTAGPSTLVLEGEAGIGKTTLLLKAVEDATAAGYAVFAARGAPGEVGFAYAAVADLLATVDPAVLETLPGVQRTALERVRLGVIDGPENDQRVVGAALLAMLHTVEAQTPVLIVLDDAQWLDSSTRAVLSFALRRIRGRIAVLVTARTGEVDSAAEQPWLVPPRPDALTRIRVGPLTLGGVHALIAARLGRTLPRPALIRIYEITSGNPFFALELAQAALDDPTHAMDDLPETLAAVVRRRVGGLDNRSATVLLAVACAATPTVELISTVTGYAVLETTEILDSLESRRIVSLDGIRIRFSHPLFATGVYSNATAAQRRALHRKLADAVGKPEARARHLALAATTADSETLEALEAAALISGAQGAPAAAAELIELAIKLGDDTAPRRIHAAELHFRAGSLPQARTHLDAVMGGLRPGTLRCVALMVLAAVEGHRDSLPGAVEALTTAVVEAKNPVLRLQALLLLTPAAGLVGDMATSVEHARAAVALADEVGIPALRSQALSVWLNVSVMYGLGVDRTALQTALDEHDAASDAPTCFHARAVAALVASWTGDLERARVDMASVQRDFAERGTEVNVLWAASQAVMIDVWLGRYSTAAAIAADAVERAEQLGGQHLRSVALSDAAVVAAYTGAVEQVRTTSAAALAAAQTCGGQYLTIAPLTTLGFLAVSQGNHVEALRILDPLFAAFDPAHGTEIVLGGWLPDAVEALCAVGRVDDAEPLVEALQTNGNRLDRPWMLVTAARGRAHCLAARGDLAGAFTAAKSALDAEERLPMPFEKARTKLLAGQLQRRMRQKQAAATTIAAALQAFDQLGTPLWAAKARAELDRLHSSRSEGVDLTPSEHRIAERAAAGLSNKQIAAELFVSEKTVEMNLTRAYRKLGVRSRSGLSGRLGDQRDR